MKTSLNANVLKHSGATVLDFFHCLLRRYNEDGCRESAAALTYTSLFAVVPLMTLVYAMFSIIPAFQGLGEQVERLVFENLIPESGQEVQAYLREFSTQARTLSGVGAFILIVTSYLMLTNIEKTFNRIWGTVGGRRGLASFLLYWGVLSFGPLLVGAGLMMHTYLLSFQLMVDEIDMLGITALLLQYLPWLLTWAGFTLLFIAMPNCRVLFRHAVVGGLVTTVLFQVAKGAFGLIVANSSFHTVYGAFAIVPLFLLWIYLCWMIVLGGAELVRTLETYAITRKRHSMNDLTALLVVCCECLRRQALGEVISDRDAVSLGIPEEQWRRLRAPLLAQRVLVATGQNNYVFARDPAKLTVWELIGLLGANFADECPARAPVAPDTYPWYARLSNMVAQSGRDARAVFEITLQELFDETKPSQARQADAAA